MSTKINASVGKGGKNVEADVLLVQMLLNRHAAAGGYAKVKENGQCDVATLKAIVEFQRAIGIASPDGKVEPGKRSFLALQERKLPPKEEPAAAPAAVKKAGKVVGKISGVQKKIIDFAEAVAEFYGKDIRVVSGKRSADDQASAMWRNWTKTLKRGKIYKYLSANPKLLTQLDKWYADANEDKSKTSAEKEESKQKFLKAIVAIGNKISLHLVGEAIDVDPACMTSAMRKAMCTGLRELPEGKDGKACFHYDTSEGTVPTVNDALKKKWPAP
jgi:hypothetical protein